MKIIALGDTHGRSFWKLILAKEKPDKVIFIGDYFDSYDFGLIEQLHNFNEIIKYKEDHPEIEIILLIGNHDHHYFPEVGYSGTSGYQGREAATQIGFLLNENRDLLQMAYAHDDILFTHAGVCGHWLLNNGWVGTGQRISEFINEVWKNNPLAFSFNGSNPTGDDVGQTPIWIRPRSLMKGAEGIKKNIIQVVGHTQQNCIDIKGKATGGKYYFIDTLGTSGEYLIIEDGEFKTGKI